jgi:hypothetical protein
MTSEFPPPELPEPASTPPTPPQPPAAPPPPPAYAQQPAGYAQPASGYQGPRQSSSQATTAMILGIVGVVACQLVGIVAVILGNQAKNEIDASGGQLDGRGQALAGIVMGWIAIGILVVEVLFVVVILIAAFARTPTG